MAHPYMALREKTLNGNVKSKPQKAPAKTPVKPPARNLKTFVSWTEGEKLDIARASLDLIAANPELARIDAVRDAVEQLPTSRRKLIKDMAHTQWILPLWDQLAAERDAQTAQNGAQRADAPPVDTQAAPTGVEPVTARLTTRGAPKLTPEEILEKRRRNGVAARAARMAKVAAGTAAPTVKWRTGEWHALAKAFRRAQAETPGISESNAAREAVASLPPDRQRKILGYFDIRKHIEPLLPVVDAELQAETEANAAHLAELAEQAQAEERARVEAAEAEQRESAERQAREQRERFEAQQHEAAHEAAMRAEMAQHAAVEHYAETVTLDQLFGLMARKLARAVLPVVMQEIKSEFARELGAFMRPNMSRAPIHSPVLDAAPAAPRKPRVFVLGGRPEWHADIKRAFDTKFDFTFNAGSAEGGNSVLGGAANADLAIVCADAVPHRDVEALRGIRGNEFERVSGGSSSIKRRLSMYLTERGQSPAH